MSKRQTADIHDEIKTELEQLRELKAALDARTQTDTWSDLAEKMVRLLDKACSLLEKAAGKDSIKARSSLAEKGCDQVREAFKLAVGSDDVWGLPAVDNAHFRCQKAIASEELQLSSLEDRAAQTMYKTRDMLSVKERVIAREKGERQEAAGDMGTIRSLEMRMKACDKIDLSDTGTQVVQRIQPWLSEMGGLNRSRDEARKDEKLELLEVYGDLIRLRYRVFEEIIRGPENLGSLTPEDAAMLMALFDQVEPTSDLVEARAARKTAMVGLKSRLY